MWAMLRDRRFCGFKFRRQHPVKPYILDFYCEEAKLVIELDGGQHNTDSARRYDVNRTEFLNSTGITVVRFWNHDVLENTDAVLEAIHNAVVRARVSSYAG
jgi:very-short-patch-repair endonuclease